ncbi:MAG: hypothetical protein K6E62_06205 [Lachnospiraceae bacterium]|nr:hypothetical protein [Lachnospiraceae bacterium]
MKKSIFKITVFTALLIISVAVLTGFKDPGAVRASDTTPTPGAGTTPTPGASTTPTPGASTTPTPGASTTPTPGASTSPTPGASTSPTPAPTTTTATANGPKIVWNSGADGIIGVQIKYTNEELAVTSSKKLYYAILKKDSDKGVKQAELIPAANGGSGDSYLIDFSTMSSSKECYIGLATTLTAGADGLVPVTNVAIAPSQRKIVFNVDWSVEGDDAKFSRVLSSVVVTNSDATVVKYVQGTPTQQGDKGIAELNIQYRKGNNTAWQSTSTLTNVKWESMKTGGAVIYFRLDAKDSGLATPTTTSEKIEPGYRYGKENKIKMAVTRASAVKLDVSKLTLSLKNGTQFRVSGAKDWITVLPFNNSSTKTDTAIRATSDKSTFDPNKESTQVKKAYLRLDEVKTALGSTLPAADQPIILETRIAATSKKSASRTATVTIPVQSEAPKAEIAFSEKQWTISGMTAPDTLAPANFEFALVKKSDVTENKLDLSLLKWSSIKNGSGIKNTAKSTYTTLGGERRSINITDADTAILIRRRGVAPSSKASAVLASKYVVLDIPRAAATGTPTPEPTGTSGTTTPAPTGTTTP